MNNRHIQARRRVQFTHLSRVEEANANPPAQPRKPVNTEPRRALAERKLTLIGG
jgi:hypothetical protein